MFAMTKNIQTFYVHKVGEHLGFPKILPIPKVLVSSTIVLFRLEQLGPKNNSYQRTQFSKQSSLGQILSLKISYRSGFYSLL